MDNTNITYSNILTNNLKGIDVTIAKNKITCFYGKSGSGKSSIAFNTINAISEYEYDKLHNKEGSNYSFVVSDYNNIIPSVAIRQINKNNNSLSTIYSFTYISSCLKKIFSYYSNMKSTNFSLNNLYNLCIHCKGIGHTYTPNIEYILDRKKPLVHQPIKYHNKSRQDIFDQKLLKFCALKNIDIHSTFDELSTAEKDMILYGASDQKIELSYQVYTKAHKKRTRKVKEHYIGILQEIEQILASKKDIKEEFLKQQPCMYCKGALFKEKIRDIPILNSTIGEIMLLDITGLLSFITSNKSGIKGSEISTSFNSLMNFLQIMVNNSLGHLYLTRNIPSLSGGEFQKIHFCSILNSSLSGILFVGDEISSNLHVSEYENIWNQIQNIKSKGNTIILVEHEDYFIQRSDIKVEVGPKGGVDGGRIVSINSYKKSLDSSFRNKITAETFIKIEDININNITHMTVNIAKNCLNCICGISGSGKSSISRYLHDRYPNFIYINQKPINSISKSIIASFSGIFTDIRELYSQENNIDMSYFTFNSENGQCHTCKGKGLIEEKISFSNDVISYMCPSCNGVRFNNDILQYTFKDHSIYELLNLTIDEIIYSNLFEESTSLTNKLALFATLGLGYLTLFRSVKSISGGESQRLKMIKYINTNIENKYFIFDEPFTGVDKSNFRNILQLFDELIRKSATIIIVEHKLEAIKNSDHIIELDRNKKNEGNIVFEGNIEQMKKSKKSIIKNYLL